MSSERTARVSRAATMLSSQRQVPGTPLSGLGAGKVGACLCQRGSRIQDFPFELLASTELVLQRRVQRVQCRHAFEHAGLDPTHGVVHLRRKCLDKPLANSQPQP